MKRILCFALLFMYTTTMMAEPALLDRLVVEINGKSYSQRQIEIYQAVRTIAMGEAPVRAMPQADTWVRGLETFKNEMIVYSLIESDAQRLESYQADQKKLEEAGRTFMRWQSNDKAFDEFIRRRGLSEAEMVRVLVTVFRVQAYVRSRVQLSSPGNNNDQVFLTIDPLADWFQSLQKLTSYRFYSKAREYAPLVPFRS